MFSFLLFDTYNQLNDTLIGLVSVDN